MLEVQSFDHVFTVVDSNRVLIGDIVDAAQNPDNHAAIRLAARSLFGYGDNAELQGTIGQLQQTIEAQRRQLSQHVIPDWGSLMTALKAAGFNNWLAAAGATNPDLLDEIARLYAAAKSSDRVGVITEYLAISTEHSPTPDQLEAWQAVLDDAEIPVNLLAFAP